MSPTHAQATNDRLFEEFNAVVTETEQLLKSVAGAGADRADALMENVEQGLAAAAEHLARIREASIRQATEAARATDDYVHGNPWQAIGIGAGLGAIAGLVAGLLVGRR